MAANEFLWFGESLVLLYQSIPKNTIVDLSETGSWTYRKLVRGPIGNWFVDLSETGSWTYAETGSWTYAETGSWTYVETGSWTYAETGSWGHSSLA